MRPDARRPFLVIALTTALATACTPSAIPTDPPSLAPAETPAATPSPLTSPAPSPTSEATVQPGEPWVVYQGGTGGPARIRLVRPDGTGDHLLVDGLVPDRPDGSYQHPDWSHDGRRIAFSAEEADGTSDLWIVDADGTDAVKVYDCAAPCGYADHPAWSPDDSTLAFVSADHTGEADSLAHLEILDVATGTRRTMLQAPDLAWFYVPRWAPDGRRIVVEATRFATARFDEEEATGSTVGVVDTTIQAPQYAPLLEWDSWAAYPDWDPRGDRIVIQQPVGADDGAADLFVIDLEAGAEPVRITEFGATGGWAIQPSWTPDGTGITFVAEDTVRTHPNAAWVGPDGTDLRRLADRYFRTHPRERPLG